MSPDSDNLLFQNPGMRRLIDQTPVLLSKIDHNFFSWHAARSQTGFVFVCCSMASFRLIHLDKAICLVDIETEGIDNRK